MSALSVALLACMGAVHVDDATTPLDFERDVLPMLQMHCTECHGASDGRVRAKGGLRLDGRLFIERGGNDGVVLIPKASAKSPLFVRSSHPADHDERMPPRGEGLDAKSLERLQRWIDEGASFGSWTGASEESTATVPARRVSTYQRLSRTVEPLSPAVLATVPEGALYEARWGALAHVSFFGREAVVDDSFIALLQPVSSHVARLDLSRTKVTDATLQRLAAWPRLVRLDLSDTAIGVDGLSALTAHPTLETVNLTGVPLPTDAVSLLAGWSSLKTVYLTRSGLDTSAVGRLRSARPTLRILTDPDWPEPPVDEPRRRRR